jgi:ribonuclease HI
MTVKKMLEHVYVRIDGASRGNPGRAGIGIVILDSNGNVVTTHREYIGMSTNNVAEYTALKRALEIASKCCRKRITILSDSELLVRQRKGAYRTRKKHLKSIAAGVDELEQVFEAVEYRSVPREENREADRLANLAIDQSDA